jgi:hypothetical protein
MVTRFTHGDEPVAKLKPHSLEGNRPASKALSRRSHGNVAANRDHLGHWQARASAHSNEHSNPPPYIVDGPTRNR